MLTESDRAEIAALLEEALAGRERDAVPSRPTAPTRRPVRLGQAKVRGGTERAGCSPSDGLAELSRSLAELRGELAVRLDHEAQERERLSRRIHQMLESGRGGQDQASPGRDDPVQGIPPVGGQEGSPDGSRTTSGSPGAPGGASPVGTKPGGAGTAQPQWSASNQGQGQGSPDSPAAGGPGQSQGGAFEGAAQKLARANFDLAEALNENLRNLKEIVDRSQELVARIENILRRQAKGRQGA